MTTPFHDQPQTEQEFHCSLETQRQLLADSPFFSSLTAEQIEDVTDRFRQQHYHAGDIIQMAGDDAEQATFCALPGRMLVLDGAVSSADAAPQPMSRAEVGGETLRAVIAALIPVVEEPDASEGA